MPAAYVLYWVDPDSGLTETVEFDVVPSAQHESTLTVTSHPVEQGAEVSDHAREEPGRVTIEGYVSNVPRRGDADASVTSVEATLRGLADPGTQTIPLDIATPPIGISLSGLVQAGIGALKRAVQGQPKGTFRGKLKRFQKTINLQMLTQAAARDRVRDIYERLEGAQTKRALITVQTPIREYFDMILERLPAQQDDETGKGATFPVDLVRIRVADSQTVQSPEPAELRGQRGKSGGSKAAKTDPNADGKTEKYQSTLAAITP